jgi:glycosyltransferase involved in cell wall biosynthesis
MKVLLVGNYLMDRQESMLRFADSLFAGLPGEGIDVRMIRPRAFFGKIKPGVHGIGKWLGYLDKFLLFPFLLRWHAGWSDVVHICDHSNAHYTAYLKGVPHLVTCNDLLAVRSARGEFPENRTSATGRMLQRLILRGLNRAMAITCISNATRQDVLRLTTQKPQAVSVTYMGLNYPYAPSPSLESAGERYLLHVGGDQWYKNRQGVLAIYKALRAMPGVAKPKLLMVGSRLEGLPDGAVSLSEVPNDELCRLYSNADLLLFPSLEEGFGWPILEAQACGCRILTTRKAPMTEVGGECAFYIDDPRDAAAAARIVADALQESEGSRRNRVAEGIENAARFSTKKMISEYIGIYQRLSPQ